MRGALTAPVLVAALLLPGAALCQMDAPDRLTPGARVRLTPADDARPIVGDVLSVDAERIVLKPRGADEALTVRRASLLHTEVDSTSAARARIAGMLTGAVIFGGVGLVADHGGSPVASAAAGAVLAMPAAFVATSRARSGSSAPRCVLAGAVVSAGVGVLGAVLETQEDKELSKGDALASGILVGAGVGAVIAAVSAKVGREHWQPVRSPQVRLIVAPVERGVAVAVRGSF